ncbi:MAG: hypothetical protein ABEJ79_06465 [Halolamina sp.]
MIPLLTVFGLFGGDDDDGNDLARVADRLGTRPDPRRVESRLDDLAAAADELTSAADVSGPAGRVSPDATPVEKIEALAAAVEAGELTVSRESPTGTRTEDGAVATAASEVRRTERPGGVAADLLERLAAARTVDDAELLSSLRDATRRLETCRTLTDRVDETTTAAEYRRLAERLDARDDDVARTLADVVADAAENSDSVAADERDERLMMELQRALDAVALDRQVGDGGVDPTVAATELADHLGGRADGERPTAAAARAVRQSANAGSATARRLLGDLADDRSGGDAVEETLRAVVEELDEAATVRSVVGDVDHDSVRDLADDVAAATDRLGDPETAAALGDRVEQLRQTVDRADESNSVVAYAARRELRFYERDLLPRLDGVDGSQGTTDDGADDAAAAVERLGDRTERIRAEFIEGVADHNHSIPLHFLSLVESLREDADDALARGEPKRAAGFAAAAGSLLDHVRDLYERNEYSVMLRRLRG